MQLAIQAEDLGKTFLVAEREVGLLASLHSLVRRRHRAVSAVSDVSFRIESGEVVGFLGPNGAGKTTTLKMLAGLLYPTAGEARVLGFVPQRRERSFLRQITLVAGQRSQLIWDPPVGDSFEVNRAIYGVAPALYRRMRDDLVDLLELAPLLPKPVRQLSLGERMKCEFAAALLHRPLVLFLDEPTIGLDLIMQRRLRDFLAEYNRRHQATLLLTSHAMADVEALCKRVIVIHEGRVLFDGDLPTLVKRFTLHKTIVVTLEHGSPDLSGFGKVVSTSVGRMTLHVPKAQVATVTERLLASLPVTDLIVADPPIEEVIEQLFMQGVVPSPPAASGGWGAGGRPRDRQNG
jgi:ABC-2 type transport system ATP-binding protein